MNRTRNQTASRVVTIVLTLVWAALLLSPVLAQEAAAPEAPPGPPADIDAQLRDIRGPVAYEGGWNTGRVAGVIGGLLALSAAFAYGAVRMSRRRAVVAPVELPPPIPLEVALERLEALGRDGLWERGAIDAFADRFSAALRDFVDGRMLHGSVAATTHELILQLQRAGLVDDAGELQDLLGRCDLAKFARQSSFPANPIPPAIQWVWVADRRHGGERPS